MWKERESRDERERDYDFRFDGELDTLTFLALEGGETPDDTCPAQPAPGKRSLTASIGHGSVLSSRGLRRTLAPGKTCPTSVLSMQLDAMPRRIDRHASGEPILAESQIDDAVLEPLMTASRHRGESLDPVIQRRFEELAGVDLSEVRIHDDAEAAASARLLNAQAFTVGNDVYFGRGQYQPGTRTGIRLLAHEVAHTLQQGSATAGYTGESTRVSQPSDASEREADDWADAFVTGFYGSLAPPAQQPTLRRTSRATVHRLADTSDPQGTWQGVNEAAVVYKDHRDPKNATSLALRSEPRPGAPAKASLKFNDRLFVSRHDPKTGWYFVVTEHGVSGYVPKIFFVNRINPPDPLARLHKIKSNESPLILAGNLYRRLIRPGHDARYFVGVLAYANGRGRDRSKGIYHHDGKDVLNWSTNWFSNSDWEKTESRAGYYIWVPSDGMARSLESSLTDGSLSNGLYARGKAVAEAVWDFVTCSAPFIAGILHGALKSLWDALTGLYELGKMIIGLFESIITGSIISDAKSLWSVLKDISVDDLKGIVLGWIGALAAGWNASNPISRWYFRGKVVGYIAAEILMLVFTAGALTGGKWLGKLGKLGAVLKKSGPMRKLISSAESAAEQGTEVVKKARKMLTRKRKGNTDGPEIRSGVKEDPGPVLRGGTLDGRQQGFLDRLAKADDMGPGLAKVGKREVTATDLAALTKHTGREHALVILKDNTRVLVDMGSYKGGTLPANTKTLLMHSHPYDYGTGMARFISKEDVDALMFLNQRYSYMVTVDGTVYRFTMKTAPNTVGEVVRKFHPVLGWVSP